MGHKRRLWKKGGNYLVAIRDERVVGGLGVVCKGKSDGKEIWKYKHVGIAKEEQGKGVGKLLMEAADKWVLDRLKENGCECGVVEVYVSENEKITLGFYEKVGFSLSEELDGHFREGEKVYVLGKELFL